jgi:hypothetical protein
LELAAAIAPAPACRCLAEFVPIGQLATVVWEEVSLLLWQAPLPQGDHAQLIQSFVERGGQVIFSPSQVPGNEEFLGMRWQSWVAPDEGTSVETWRGDQDLLAHALSGQALPVGDLQVRRYCQLSGEYTPLAVLQGGAPLIARVPTERGGVYFWTTTAAPADSSLATSGVVLYVGIQRALASGAAVLGNTRNLPAGQAPVDIPAQWEALAGSDQTVSNEYAFHQGVYAAGERLLAVNREGAEDRASVLDASRVAGLFQGLEFARVDDRAGSVRSLVQEIWRLFLAAMIVAMIVEAALCFPKLRRTEGAAT